MSYQLTTKISQKMKSTILFTLICATMLTGVYYLLNPTKHAYVITVIFDTNKPLGDMGVQYVDTLTSSFDYSTGDTLRGLSRDVVVIKMLNN